MSRIPAYAGLLPLAVGCLAGVFVSAAALAIEVGDAPPPCSASAALEPDRAVAGQQVLYRLEILSREDVGAVTWREPPSFPAIRSERLPGRPLPGSVARAGARYRRQEERVALFPERIGLHVLRGPELRCAATAGAEGVLARVPDTRLRVEPLPEVGRPPTFDGLVGPLSLRVTVTPREMRVGESVRVAFVLRGGGNLWDAGPPLDTTSFGDAEVFALRPSLALERGRVLSVRRHYGYELVPRRAGPLTVPAVRVPYFDPESWTYAVATTAEVPVRVTARQTVGGDARERERAGSSAAAPSSAEASGGGPRASVGVLRLVGLAALVASALAIGLRMRRRRAPDTGEALERAARARRAGDAAGEATALESALRRTLARRVPDARAVTPEELRERVGQPPPVERAAQLLAALERSRFDPAAPPPDADAVVRAIDGLNRTARRSDSA